MHNGKAAACCKGQTPQRLAFISVAFGDVDWVIQYVFVSYLVLFAAGLFSEHVTFRH